MFIENALNFVAWIPLVFFGTALLLGILINETAREWLLILLLVAWFAWSINRLFY